LEHIDRAALVQPVGEPRAITDHLPIDEETIPPTLLARADEAIE